MKRILILILMLTCCISAFAQLQITTKKEKLSDFPTKTIKIVMSSDVLMDKFIKDAVKNIWTISPFEFCSKDEFLALKGNADYYFMAVTTQQKYAGIYFLNIVKGGEGDDIASMLNVAEFPICGINNIDRLDAFLPAIINIMQNYIIHSLQSGWKTIKHSKLSHSKAQFIFISSSDLDTNIQYNDVKKYKHKGIIITDEDNADKEFINGSNALVSYSIIPNTNEGVCFNLLFDARNLELYFLQKHKLSKKYKGGFTKSDIKKIIYNR